MNKIHLADIGILEDTVIYELVPVEVKRMNGATLKEVEDALKDIGVSRVLVDSSLPEAVEHLRLGGFRVITGRL